MNGGATPPLLHTLKIMVLNKLKPWNNYLFTFINYEVIQPQNIILVTEVSHRAVKTFSEKLVRLTH
jgi:hypothetical protein